MAVAKNEKLLSSNYHRHIESALLRGEPSFSHGFFARGGSENESLVTSPSPATSASPDACAKLGLLASSSLSGFSHFICARQYHSNEVICLTETSKLWSSLASAPRCDGIVTNLSGVLLGVYTADCAPVLFADGRGRCGVAHAGWRGALGGIVESLVRGMVSLGSRVEDINVAIGPTISVSSYEVSDDFVAAILAHEINLTPNNEVFFHKVSPKISTGDRVCTWHFDLGEYVCARLRGCGISAERIDFMRLDTFSDRRYFSHRRSVRTGEEEGRNFSCIGLL